jgi:hypothetical protein
LIGSAIQGAVIVAAVVAAKVKMAQAQSSIGQRTNVSITG